MEVNFKISCKGNNPYIFFLILIVCNMMNYHATSAYKNLAD